MNSDLTLVAVITIICCGNNRYISKSEGRAVMSDSRVYTGFTGRKVDMVSDDSWDLEQLAISPLRRGLFYDMFGC